MIIVRAHSHSHSGGQFEINVLVQIVPKVAKGASQVIIRLVGGDDDVVRAVNALAKCGLRTSGVISTCEGSMDEFEHIDGNRRLVDYRQSLAPLGLTRVIVDANHLVDSGKSEDEITEHWDRLYLNTNTI
ncbi:hypothetical protein BGZ76_002758 [Entomortierella beljakovae]|nr:hypothetical protein BGZ76_002758 [Entomortierella beljakovae]